ncbi:DMT family transporter [Motiliproteus coralliicola]|uniref:DMT family transporter n=1 Tax=Motiliproteus coralliicola TaxID=2283196 RepID=A0A369WUH1_9GAMM|nr:DMT family transporter [Motiliproteus coralliicola]RDE25297.1 DMT family transporter [Motiliproteus coralliicola]
MSTPIAYATVIVIWSTTPLAIIWSSETVTPVMAAMLRMMLAAVVGLGLLRWLRIPLPWHGPALKSYLYATLGVYGAMFTTYMAASQLSSGLISLIFGMSPIVSGLLAQFWLGEKAFSPLRWLALLLALSGLGWVLSDGLVIETSALAAVGLMLLAVLLFSISGVLVKGVSVQIHPLAQTVGALCCSIPFYALSWLLMDGQLPDLNGGGRSLAAIIYLGLFGSLVGFVAYYYILQQLAASTVALITLITPVLAISLGSLLNQEPLTLRLIQGSGLICLGLALYQWSGRRLGREVSQPQAAD